MLIQIDVYSFGIVMWEILTGEDPYDGMHYGGVIGMHILTIFPLKQNTTLSVLLTRNMGDLFDTSSKYIKGSSMNGSYLFQVTRDSESLHMPIAVSFQRLIISMKLFRKPKDIFK